MYEAYAAVERSYSQGRYDEALNQAKSLLAALDANPEDPLRPRLLLLIGHCHLYGLADAERATNAYQEVLDHCGEPVLREIAEQSLGICASAAPTGSTPVSSSVSAPVSSPAGGEASPAMPWLTQIGTSTTTAAVPQAAFAPFQAPVEAPTTPAPDPAPEIRSEPLPQVLTEPRPEPVPTPRPAPGLASEFQLSPEATSVVQPEPEPQPIAPHESDISEPELIIPELMAEPEPPARPSSAFTLEEEEELARGLLLVEL